VSSRDRIEAAITRLGGALPSAVQLALSGRRPIRLDGQELDPGIQFALRALELRGSPTVIGPRGADPTPEAVRTHTHREALVGSLNATPVGEVTQLTVDGGDGPLNARHYMPADEPADRPLLVYLHGGGMTIGDLETHDEPCRLLCRHAAVHVLSVEYRLAPEHPFPAPVEDAVAAFRWAATHAAELGADPGRVGVGGDSAGGNLSAVVSQLTARDGGPAPAVQLLIYPSTDYVHETESMRIFADGFYLSSESRRWFDGHYLNGTGADRADPRISPLRAPDLSGLAPAIVVTAAFDPLRDEGEQYAHAMRDAGTNSILYRAPGMIHGFLHMTALRGPRDEVMKIAGMLRAALVSSEAPAGSR
jgi:acetyl esterase